MTVEFDSGMSITYKQNDAGVLMSSGSIDSRFSPVANVNTDLRGLYDRAAEKGYKVTLHSASELASGDARMKASKERNYAAIANVNTDLRGLYDRAAEKGYKVTLHSASELASGDARMKASKERNYAAIGDAEVVYYRNSVTERMGNGR